jgi:1-acyl-sn-glycerol-3-phosphate acyltransferase
VSADASLTGRLWYDFAWCAMYAAFTAGFSLRYSGWANMPAHGPVLIVSNHQSMLDPVPIGLASRRRLTFLARKNLFDQPVLAPIMRSLGGGIPIDRGFGKEGIHAVLAALEEGRAVALFPEGERTHTGQVQPFKPGVSLLIKRVKCPIVPVGIAGAYAAWSRHMKWPRFSPLFFQPGPSTLAVAIGKPIDPARYADMDRDEMLADLHREIVRQFEAAEPLRRK